ncbi:Hypothetical Protein SiL_0400 [Sulfolobus islandicus LAL14/1]|uniref:Uncharacterized protein n=2 Tax=Saccharolobus islandicus TaxID=43080 RepID=M9U4C7_SACIS|nr:Hypothetical Protein SiL_0400 [Sulfolobus islandicus LAL14/1]
MGNMRDAINNSFIASFLIFVIVEGTFLFFWQNIGFVTSISVHAPPSIKIVVPNWSYGVNNLPRYTKTYMQIWITNELNTSVRIYNLTILPKGNAEIVQVCDYAPYVNANNIPAQDLNGVLEPQETVVLLVAYNLSYMFYIGSMTIILHANTTA